MGGGETIKDTGGVRPMNVGGRVSIERERLTHMSAEDRAWRKKYLADQIVRSEPNYVKVAEKELLNPFRRLYRFPLDFVFKKFVGPFTGQAEAAVLRFYTGRILLGLYGTFGIFYYFKYNTNTWQHSGSWRVIKSKTAVFPGEPGYPAVSPPKDPHQYYDRGFKDSVLAKPYPQYQDK
jgi:NADH dehydrogenase (ubiquinone) 1 beta subcomplex subunit 6